MRGTLGNIVLFGSHYSFKNAQAKAYWEYLDLQNGGPISGGIYGVSTSSLKKAIDNFFITGTVDAWISLMIALYLCLGGTAATHAVNAINPGAYGITWVGSPTHDGDGVTLNGTTQYGSIALNPSTVLSATDIHLCVLSNISSASNQVLMGCRGVAGTSEQLQLAYLSTASQFAFDAFDNNTAQGRVPSSTNQSTGEWAGSRLSNIDAKLYLEGVQDGSITTSGGTNPNTTSFGLGCRLDSGSPILYSQGTFKKWSLGNGITADQALSYRNATRELNLILNR